MSDFKKYYLAIKSYSLFIAIDIGFTVFGFGKVYDFFVKRGRRRVHKDLRPDNRQIVSNMCKAVETATRYYYRPRKDCLPKALTLYHLLRKEGIPVDFCLGVKKYPFSGHSWVEYQGEAVDDREAKAYTLISRM